MTQNLMGLNTAQVKDRMAAGEKNTAPEKLTKSIKQIIIENTFTLFNLINLFLGFLVFLTGSYKNMLFLFVAVMNTSIGIFQEIRAKRQVDKMALLSQSKVKVIRNGQETEIEPDQIVLDDLIVLQLGDQVPVDGLVKATKELEIDESQITGESDVIVKKDGQTLISGSFVVSGHAIMQATKVGSATFVNSLTEKVSKTAKKNSVLLNLINKIIRILTVIIIPLGLLLFVSRLFHGVSLNHAILGTVAAMIGMIPEGLVLLSSVTLAISAYHLARKRVLVRDLASIETLARVDTLCLDKTGTITNGKLKFKELVLADDAKQADAAAILGSLVHEVNDTNETADAIKAAFSQHPYQAQEIVPFSSARKWSGVKLSQGNFVLGAPQFVLQLTDAQKQQVHDFAAAGNRVLALVSATDISREGLQNTKLMAYILITDVIREDAPSTLHYFADQGVTVKVISGDDPTTVAAIAKRTGIKNADRLVDMTTVADDADYHKLVAQTTVFGRVKPEQKERLVKAMQDNGHTVAMTGDGVNDILALRQSNCGIAMASGNESTKSIADFVLIDSNFSALINVLNEGRRVINNIDTIAALYLIKTMFSIMLSLIFIFIAKSYPFQPIQLTPINSLMVGIPSFLLALSPEFHPIRNRFFTGIVEIALPSALCVVLYIMMIGGIGSLLSFNVTTTDTLNVLLTGLIGWQALILVSRPFNRYKLMIITFSISAFMLLFICFGKFFYLTNLFTWQVGGIGLLLILTINPVFIVIQKIVNHFYQKRLG
ncbi:HAD-IC family P-type ATPase [Fructilactobacillus sp. Tb1]|uniref:HAD-IC family P-type ATPase n=1 Tax=Fructilactobacillus sp. Tb1 TaxID=3422304 RepID=UPI003D2AEDEA